MKKILSILIVMTMLFSVVLPVFTVYAGTTPTVIVKSGNTTFANNGTYTLNAGDKITISASTNVDYISYKVGTGDVVKVNNSSVTLTVPSEFSEYSLQAYVPGMEAWTYYNIKVNGGNVVTTGLVVKSGNATFENNGTYTLDMGDKIQITASNADYIKYKVGEGEVVTVNGSFAEVTVPSNFAKFSLQAFARVGDKIIGWNSYNIVVRNYVEPSTAQLVVKSGNTTFANNGTYTLNAGDKIEITTTKPVEYIKYKVGTGDVVVANNSATLTVPSEFSEYSLQAYIPGMSDWNMYNIKVNPSVTTQEPVITVKSGNTTFANNGTYTLNAGDKVVISATPEIEYIKYKIGTGDVVTVNASSAEVTVPSDFSEYSLQVFARGKGGTAGWNLYNIFVNGNNSEAPVITVKSGDQNFKNNGTYNVAAGDKIVISATPDVEYIKYKVGTGDVVTVNGSTATITVPDNLAKYSLQVFARGKGGTAGWNLYNIVVEEENNYEYPLVIRKDEKLNNDVEGVAISLRTIALTEKTGSENYFELEEKIQYNIDFVNMGKEIKGDVYIYFTVPSNVRAKFIETNGGKQIDEYTIRWTLNGLAKGEKGTIPVILRYVSMDGDSQIVKPYAKIVASSNEDMSAVINLIYSGEGVKIETAHKPFMIGDAGTNTFRPLEGLNRAEMAIILTRIFNIPLVEDYTVTYKDYDVMQQGKYKWAEQAIMTVTKYGLMEGYDDGEFKPGAKVTYAQLVTVLARQLEIENNVSGLNPFKIKDQPIKLFKDLNKVYSSYGYTNHWAAKYLAQMVRLNMLKGFSNDYDGDVDEVIARADVAKLISQVLLRGPSEDGTSGHSLTNTFVDVSTRTKNYDYILEATADAHNSKFTNDGIEIMTK